MTPEDEQYFRDLTDMFATDGWKALVKEFEEKVDEVKIEAIPNEAVLHYVQGQLNIINGLVNMETTIEAAYEAAKEDSKYADADI